jgi:GDPmannose 4,6-dehydratase
VDLLLGDASKAREKMGWAPKHTLQELAKEMVHADIEHFRKDVVLKESGFHTLRQFE